MCEVPGILNEYNVRENMFLYGYSDKLKSYVLSKIPHLGDGRHIMLAIPGREYASVVLLKGAQKMAYIVILFCHNTFICLLFFQRQCLYNRRLEEDGHYNGRSLQNKLT